MKKIIKIMFFMFIVSGLMISVNASGLTQEWPTKTITTIVSYGAGGSSDMSTRAITDGMEKYLGQPIRIIYMPGGGATIGITDVLNSKPDGYKWIGGGAAFALARAKLMKYADTDWTDFYGFMSCTTIPYYLLVKEDSPWETVDELVEDLRANPGKFRHGSSGVGTVPHLATIVTLDILGLEAIHIPYSGAHECMSKLAAGEIDFSFECWTDCGDYLKAGKLRVLGTLNSKPVEVEVDPPYMIPSLLEKFPKLEKASPLFSCGFGIFVPREVPDDIVVKITKAFLYATDQPKFKEFCEEYGLIKKIVIGEESDKFASSLSSFYTWALYDGGFLPEGLSPAEFNIPRPNDWEWPSSEVEGIKPWPNEIEDLVN